MKFIKKSLMLMATVLAVLFHQQAHAQAVLRQNVLGNGGAMETNGTHRLAGTVGQPVAGVTSNSSQAGKIGFWYPVFKVDSPIGNQLPLVANRIAGQTLTAGASFTQDLEVPPVVFSDPDGDPLLYSATSSDPSKATVTVSGSTLTVTAAAAGSAKITVTAEDQKSGAAVTDFMVTVTPPPNRPPVVANLIPDQTLAAGNASFVRDLNAAPAVFSDPDNDVLSYTATSNDPSKATATIVGSTLTVLPVAAGSVTIAVTANDNKGGTATTIFAVTVNPSSPRYTLVASPSTVAPGAQLRVEWTAPSGSSAKDWIGLYRIGAANTSFLWWQYTQGVPSGYFTPNAPTQPGQYEFRYFLNDGYTETARSNPVTVLASWTYDTFDQLNLGSLHGQNGWVTVAGSSPASVVLNPSGAGKVMDLKAPAGGKVFMSKTVNTALSGTLTLELKVRVEQPNSASMAKLEVNTNNGTFWDKKFQIYFGASMRLNNSPSTAINFLSQAVPQQWYTVKVVFNLGTNLLDLYLDGVLVLNDVTIGAGTISGIAVTGFSVSPNYVLLDDIGGYTGGLTKITNQDVVAESAETMPSSFDLAQNYPNPFNPETTIQYAIPGPVSGPMKVTLRIYNLQGQVVRTLVDEQKSPGQYRVVWDGKNDLGARIATGVYLYTITAGEFKATKRMTILK